MATAEPTVLAPSRDRWDQRVAEHLSRPVAAGSTVAFRVAFGLIVVVSSIRFVWRGWIGEFYLTPDHHLTYTYFEWVRPLPGPAMYTFVLMLGALGVCIAVGLHYRIAAATFALGFAYTELIDAGLYLNHYWYVTLAAFVLAVAPSPSNGYVPVVTVWALRAQIACVYLFAGFAKLNPDWLFEAQPLDLWLSARTDRPVIGPWLGESSVAYLMSWGGAFFDLTIVGWLLWKRSRPFAYAAVVVFHVATAMLFQIGLFPWVMIALTPVFFQPGWPSRLAGKLTKRAPCHGEPATPKPVARWSVAVLALLVVLNIVLPLRHYAAEGNVRFNDDGYYLSWRVMLSERTSFLEFEVTDSATGSEWTVGPGLVLEEWQSAQANRRPDLALATAHLIAADFDERGYPYVTIHAQSWVSFNGRSRQQWIDPNVDLADLSRRSAAAEYVLPLEAD